MYLTPHTRAASHVTLGLAVLTLCAAQEAFLPGSLVLAPVPLVCLVAGFVLAGRWELPYWVANALGVIVLGATAAWLGTYIWVTWGPDAVDIPPPPVTLLPRLGPLLQVLLVIKIFLPQRTRDVWALHAIGLSLVGLACVIAAELWFGPLLAAYALSATWFVARFHQETERQLALPSTAPEPRLFAGALGWTMAATALALVVFLLVPRHGLTWDASRGTGAGRRMSATGHSESIDLNRVGHVQVDDEVAFEVLATDARGEPLEGLGDEQRWRGSTLDTYFRGRWVAGYGGSVTSATSRSVELRAGGGGPGPIVLQPGMAAPPPPPRLPVAPLPEAGERQRKFEFTAEPRRAGGLFLAEPIVFQTGAPSPIEMLQPSSGIGAIFTRYHGTLTLTQVPASYTGVYRYRQNTRAGDGEHGPPAWVEVDYALFLAQSPSPRLREFTNTLLADLAARGVHGLTPEAVAQPRPETPDVLRGEPARWETIARGLSEYLATSGDYEYTLELRRSDPSRDPVEDFLENVKAGHCERFATALALMLRTQGIPTRVVKGFVGVEAMDGVAGGYVVRQSRAHSWVEAIVPRPGDRGRPVYGWLTLDPTPGGEARQAAEAFSWARWWDGVQRGVPEWWRRLVLDYSADTQSNLWFDLTQAFQGGRGWERFLARRRGLVVTMGVALVALLAVVVRRVVRRRRRKAADPLGGTPLYRRLLGILKQRVRLQPTAQQTPREFAEATAATLTPRVGGELAQLPEQVVVVHYRVRYGGETPSGEEVRATEARLLELERALT